MARSWILRLRLKSPRRMTALLEGSKNQMGMMGGFSPVLVEQILLPIITCLRTATNTGLRGNVFVHFRSHYVRNCRICLCKQHLFIKLHQFTNARESVLIDSRMSFCTKGIHPRSCRIQCLAKRRKTFSLGRRCPSGRMRGGETHGF